MNARRMTRFVLLVIGVLLLAPPAHAIVRGRLICVWVHEDPSDPNSPLVLDCRYERYFNDFNPALVEDDLHYAYMAPQSHDLPPAPPEATDLAGQPLVINGTTITFTDPPAVGAATAAEAAHPAPPGFQWIEYSSNTFMHPTGTGTIAFDVRLEPAAGQQVSSRGAEYVSSANPLFTVEEELSETFLLNGQQVSSLGVAGLTPTASGVTVSNIGSSGEDGFVVDPELAVLSGPSAQQPTLWETLGARWDAIDAPGSITEGSFMELQAHGLVVPGGNQELATVRFTKVTPRFAMTADLSALGSTSTTVQAYLAGSLVASATGLMGGLGTVTTLPTSCDIGGVHVRPSGLGGTGPFRDMASLRLAWEQSTVVTLPGAGDVQADEVRILPSASAAHVGGMSFLSCRIAGLTTGGAPELHVAGVAGTKFRRANLGRGRAVLFGQRADDPAPGRVTVRNIGSSGMDGIALEVRPGDVAVGATLSAPLSSSFQELQASCMGSTGGPRESLGSLQLVPVTGGLEVYADFTAVTPPGKGIPTLQIAIADCEELRLGCLPWYYITIDKSNAEKVLTILEAGILPRELAWDPRDRLFEPEIRIGFDHSVPIDIDGTLYTGRHIFIGVETVSPEVQEVDAFEITAVASAPASLDLWREFCGVANGGQEGEDIFSQAEAVLEQIDNGVLIDRRGLPSDDDGVQIPSLGSTEMLIDWVDLGNLADHMPGASLETKIHVEVANAALQAGAIRLENAGTQLDVLRTNWDPDLGSSFLLEIYDQGSLVDSMSGVTALLMATASRWPMSVHAGSRGGAAGRALVLEYDFPAGTSLTLAGPAKRAVAGDRLSITAEGGVATPGPYRGIVLEPRSIRYMVLGTPTVVAVEDPVPAAPTTLHPGYPNPFNPSTTLSFDLARAGSVSLKIYSIDGRLVRTLLQRHMDPGLHRVHWDGTNATGHRVSSGVYQVRLQSPDGVRVESVVLLK